MPYMDTPSKSGSTDQLDMDGDAGLGEEEEDEELDIDDLIELGDDGDNDVENGGNTSDEESILENEPIRDDAVCVFKKHAGSVFCCHLDPKTGTLAVTGSEDDKAYVWNTTTGEVVFECNNHQDSVVQAEFSYDGTYLATADMCGVVQVWKVSTSSVVFTETIGDCSWMKWHPGSAVLMCASVASGIYIWKIPNGQCKVLPSLGVTSDCGLFMPDGRRATIGYSDGRIRVYELKSCAVVAAFETEAIPGEHTMCVTCLDAHLDNNMIAAGNVDGQVRLHKTQTAKLVAVFDAIREPGDDVEGSTMSYVESLRFSPDPNLPLIVTGYLSGLLLVWDITKQVLRHRLKMECGTVKLLWDRHSMKIFAGLLDGSVNVFDVRDGSLKSQLLGHRDNILDAAVSKDGSILLTASEDKTARIFNLTSAND